MSMKNTLLDTDIGPDCDDVGALAMLNLYMEDGLCQILGIGHCTSNPYGAGAIDAVNLYYGHADIPIGSCGRKGFLTDEFCMKYNRPITQTLENRYRDTQPEPAVRMYRRILAQQPDKSVDFIAIGPMDNLSDLLNSAADEFSPLNGIQLVEKKVRQLVAMAGIYPSKNTVQTEKAVKEFGLPFEEIAEYNVMLDIPSAQHVAESWPGPRTFLGFEAGLVRTGGHLLRGEPGNHPVRMAYQLYTDRETWFSWDLMTVEYAVVPDCGHYSLSPAGTVRFDGKGRTLWTPDENGIDHFIELAAPENMIAADIDHLLLRC